LLEFRILNKLLKLDGKNFRRLGAGEFSIINEKIW